MGASFNGDAEGGTKEVLRALMEQAALGLTTQATELAAQLTSHAGPPRLHEHELPAQAVAESRSPSTMQASSTGGRERSLHGE